MRENLKSPGSAEKLRQWLHREPQDRVLPVLAQHYRNAIKRITELLVETALTQQEAMT
jgi:hypothetical protein